jgi:DNA-binding Lrp family transcriptional regulator
LCSKKIDYIDIKIIRDLLIDGRKEFTAIAEEAGVSKDVIWQHYRKLEGEGIVVGATVMVNYTALGRDINAGVSLTVSMPEQEHVMEQMDTIDGLYGIYRWEH